MYSIVNVMLTKFVFYYFTLSTVLRFLLVLLFSSQEPVNLGEKRVRLMVNIGIVADLLVVLSMVSAHHYLLDYAIHNFLYLHVTFSLSWGAYALSFMCFATVILSLVTRFSIYYLHRDNYFFKFFALIYILEFAIFLLVSTKGTESVFIGWELLGLSSVLLIAFYEHRSSVLKNSLLILVVYKISDILFYYSLIYASWKGISLYTDISSNAIICLILLACLIKSSIFPWIWLPRAMEGPTPSSAVFYGGLATHVPIFIFMNVWMNAPVHSQWFIWIAFCGILVATVFSTALSRQSPDAKNAIAYSAITQLSIIYVEILFGFYTLAITHCIVHGIYRSIEYLKSPSLLYHRHSIARNRSAIADETGLHIERLMPVKLRSGLYKLALNEFVLPRALIHIIELFLGFQSSRICNVSLRGYIFPTLFCFLLLELITSHFTHKTVGIFDEGMLVLSYLFNVLALFNKYKPWLFFASLIASMACLFSVLFDKVLPYVVYLDLGLIVLFAVLLVSSISKYLPSMDTQNYTGIHADASNSSILVLLLGFAIVGIPGLGSFVLWEHLEAELISIKPDLLIDCFFLVTLNTIVFFRFYYATYLGKHRPDKQFAAAERC